LLGASAVVAYSLFRKSAALGRLNFYPEVVRDLQFDGITPVITVGLAAQNTSNQNFDVKSLAGNVYSNSYLVGNVSLFQAVTIPANQQVLLLVNMRMSLLGIVDDIINAIQTGNTTQKLDLEAYANVDDLQIPVNISYKVGK
jgi:LEA14-like dessication related protein